MRVQPSAEVDARDAGLDLSSKLNRWLIAGAVGVTSFLSLIAAHGFHGHSASSRSAIVSRSVGQTSAGASGAGGLTSSVQPPQAASPAAAAPPVVSGGS